MAASIWTRATYLAELENAADVKNDIVRYPLATRKYWLGHHHAQLWKDLLNQNKNMRVIRVDLTLDANSQFQVAALDTIIPADTMKLLYRIIAVSDGARIYELEDFEQNPLAGSTGFQVSWGARFQRVGDRYQILPLSPGQAWQVYLNHTPTPIDRLTGDSIVPEFFDSYEFAIVNLAAADLLAGKGGQEQEEAAGLRSIGERIKQQLLSDMSRETTRPTFGSASDDPGSWGGM